MDFSIWTRKDFLDFDARRQEVMQPTPKETAEQELAQETYRKQVIQDKLSKIGLTRPNVITKEFVLGMLEQMNAQQFVGENLSGWIDNQEILFGSLEIAFDDLIIRYL